MNHSMRRVIVWMAAKDIALSVVHKSPIRGITVHHNTPNITSLHPATFTNNLHHSSPLVIDDNDVEDDNEKQRVKQTGTNTKSRQLDHCSTAGDANTRSLRYEPFYTTADTRI